MRIGNIGSVGNIGLSRRSLPAIVWTIAVVMMALSSTNGCTLAVDTRITQCQGDRDCVKFAGAVCDLAARICRPATIDVAGMGSNSGGRGGASAVVGGSGGVDGGGSGCQAPGGCVPCASTVVPDLTNKCTDATCVPFDNGLRLSNLDGNGALKPLP